MNSKLTPAQNKIFNLLRKGLTNKEIATELGISYYTVTHQIWKSYKKLGVKTRIQAARKSK